MRAVIKISELHLLQPLTAGRLKLKNRVVFPAHQTLLSEEGVIGPRMRAYYAERARGGVAAVIVEGGAVHDTTIKFPNYLWGHRQEIIPTYVALQKDLSQYGCKTIIQLVHSGSRMSSHDSRLPLWAPSDVRSAISPEIPHVMTAEEIGDVLDGYEKSFQNAAEGGVDGIEIHAAHEYLLGQFLSPLNNLRNDEYGGSLDNRMRLLNEVVMLARKTVGDDMIVGIRINGSDLVDASLDNDDYIEIARNIEALASIDYLSISAGTSRDNHMIVPPMDTPEGLYVDYAANIRKAVTLPVMAVGRLKNPELAEEVIATGKADVVAQARALIADPFWVQKLYDQTPQRIRPCIGCNQGCFGYLYTNRPITCAVNPAVGHEKTLGYGTEIPASGRHVLVVGGGPAGMEAAIAASERGLDVTLAEATNALGGQIPLASSIDSRAELGSIIDFQISELKRLNVDIRLETTIDKTAMVAINPDTVIIATGSQPRSKPIPGDESIHVISPIDAMKSPEAHAEKKAIIIDDVAHFPAYAPAEALMDAGANVTILTPKLFIGSLLDQATMVRTLRRLASKGIEMIPNTAVVSITGGYLHVRDTLSGFERTENADVIVAAVGNKVVDGLVQETAGVFKNLKIRVVGDASAPRTILEAIREGREAGSSI
jgi:2,4-dienoyl-CoA reductase-like NADH-dependent reductase (Old Yellow Enzyme family)/thioredoxin reductase